MTHTLLQIDASATFTQSTSRKATQDITASLSPTTVIKRDVATESLPHVTQSWVTARLIPEDKRSADQKATLALSDKLIAELEAADTIVIGLPVYNFGMPASLKAWIDLIARPGVTFSYTPEGPKGLLSGKRAIIAVAAGGTQIDSPADFASTHLKFVLGFIGITDVEIVNAKDYLPAEVA